MKIFLFWMKWDRSMRHEESENKKESDGIKAILLRSEGRTFLIRSQTFRIHQSTIIRHIEDYKSGKLKNESAGLLS